MEQKLSRKQLLLDQLKRAKEPLKGTIPPLAQRIVRDIHPAYQEDALEYLGMIVDLAYELPEIEEGVGSHAKETSKDSDQSDAAGKPEVAEDKTGEVTS